MTDPNATGVSFAVASNLHPGRRLGSYRLVRELGEGAFAEVWLAVHEGEHGFRKKVALKLLKELTGDKLAYESLLNEARLCGLLHHQRIVDVFGVKQVDGLTFVAMEYVKGVTLDEVLGRVTSAGMQVPLAVILEIGIGLCEALDHAHNAKDDMGSPLQIVHRDLKPGNVMLAPGVGVKVTDFGLAKATTSRTKTMAGQVRGTPGYIAPEVWSGTRDFLPTVDLFAVGVVLWELATGRRLFDGSILEVMGQAMNGDEESEMDVLRRYRPELVPVVSRLLRREPRRRTQTAWEALVELREMHEQVGTAGALDVFLELVGVTGSQRLGDTSAKLATVDAAWTGLMQLAGVATGGSGPASANDHMGAAASSGPAVIDDEDDWYDDPMSSSRATMAVSVPSQSDGDLWPSSPRGVEVRDPEPRGAGEDAGDDGFVEDSMDVLVPASPRWLPVVVLGGAAALALVWVGFLWSGPAPVDGVAKVEAGAVGAPPEASGAAAAAGVGDDPWAEDEAAEPEPRVDELTAETDPAAGGEPVDPVASADRPAVKEAPAKTAAEPAASEAKAEPAASEAKAEPAASEEAAKPASEPAASQAMSEPAATEPAAVAIVSEPAPKDAPAAPAEVVAAAPSTGCLVFQSRPVGADVLLDGVGTGLLAARGETAVRTRSPGPVEVSMATEGVVLATQAVDVVAGTRTVVRCDLLSGGTCTVRSAPGSCD